MTIMLLEWVFTASFLILVVLALRAALGKRVSAGLRYALWGVVLVRLLVPVQLFTSPLAGTWIVTGTVTEKHTGQTVYSTEKLYNNPNEGEIRNDLSGQGVTHAAFPISDVPVLPNPPAAPEPPRAPDLTKAPAWLGWVWLAGSGLTALVLLLSNRRFWRRLRRCRVPLDGVDRPLRVYAAEGLPSPCLFGVLRPAVYVTPEAAADPDMLRHVLAHEYTHYRHGDHLWSLLRCGALAVHWWNPLVWLAARLSQRDGELACDEGALKRLGDGERAAYGGTLLALVTAKPGPGDLFRCATTMAGDKKSLKERIARIAQAPRRWLWAAAVAVLVTALACVCAFGQAEPEEPKEEFWPDGVSELTFLRDKGGFGGDFSVHLERDGGFTYYAGLLSSYIGMGTWTREDDVICLADEGLKDSAGIQRFYFKIDGGDLLFQAEDSAQFMYVDVADGERFSRQTDGLSFSMDENGNVSITGEVNGLALGEGAYWQPSGAPARSVTFSCPFAGASGGVRMTAWRDSQGAVSVRTWADGTDEGYWTFTVDLLGVNGAAVKDMTSHTAKSVTVPRPASISEEEAVRATRIAARLLTAAEEWYENRDAQKDLRCELSFSLNEQGNVAIAGTVNGLTLGENTYWHPAIDAEHPITYLAMENPPYIAGDLEAWWGSDERASVMVTTAPSVPNVGAENTAFWTFAVDLETGTVTEMAALASMPGHATSETLRPYPETISDEEAAATARIAAKLLTAAEDWYLSHTAPEVELACDTAGVPRDVLEAVKADVAQTFQTFAPGGWLTHWGSSFNDETNKWEPMPLAKRVGFDGVRVNRLQGPWTGTVWGNTDVEVWRINYEYHASTPEFAENILVGGMYLTEDGWLCPTYSDSTYLIFTLGGQGKRSFALSLMYNMGGPSEDEEESALFFQRFYPYVGQMLAGKELIGPDGLAPDLNRNGVPEELRVASVDGGAGTKLEVWEKGRLLFTEEGYFAHAGWNALFLYHDEDGDYLLRYHPTMYQGSASYTYQLFTLENGGETVREESSVEFDINFQPWLHQKFDVNEITGFMDRINELLAGSVQLLNTDGELLDTFERNGRLHDDLGWLNGWEPIYARGDRTLPDELWRFKAAMEEQWTDPWGLTVTAGSPTPTRVILNFLQGGYVDGELYGVPTGRLQYVDPYWLERADGNGWSAVPKLDSVKNWAWNDMAYDIPKNGRCSVEVDWSWLYGELSPGRYRIGKEVMDYRAPGDYDVKPYYAEFEVR